MQTVGQTCQPTHINNAFTNLPQSSHIVHSVLGYKLFDKTEALHALPKSESCHVIQQRYQATFDRDD